MQRPGDRIRTLREKTGLRLTHLAVMADLNAGSLLHIERGDRQPTPQQAARLEAALGLKPATLTGQPCLSLGWRRAPTLDAAAIDWLRAAAHRGVADIPFDLERVMVWRGRDGELLIVPAVPAV